MEEEGKELLKELIKTLAPTLTFFSPLKMQNLLANDKGDSES